MTIPYWMFKIRMKLMSRIRRIVFDLFGYPLKAILIIQYQDGTFDATYWGTMVTAKTCSDYRSSQCYVPFDLYDVFYTDNFHKNLDQLLEEYWDSVKNREGFVMNGRMVYKNRVL